MHYSCIRNNKSLQPITNGRWRSIRAKFAARRRARNEHQECSPTANVQWSIYIIGMHVKLDRTHRDILYMWRWRVLVWLIHTGGGRGMNRFSGWFSNFHDQYDICSEQVDELWNSIDWHNFWAMPWHARHTGRFKRWIVGWHLGKYISQILACRVSCW